MIALSFRIKLLLAMMLLVAGVTGATLYVTQQKVAATYLKLSQDQFEAEVNYFTLQQENRLSPVRDRCAELAKLPALRDALVEAAPDHIYEIATNFLNSQQAGRAARVQARAMAMPTTGTQLTMRNPQTLFRVLNAKGEILHPSETRIGLVKAAARKHFESQLTAVQQAVATMDEQPVGYLTSERTNGALQLLEVIATKITDPDTQQPLGALVLAVPFREDSEQDINNISHGDIESGIWLAGHLYGRTIPNTNREAFTAAVTNEFTPAGQPLRDTFNLTLGGAPRRVFFKLLNPGSPFPPAYQVSLYSMVGANKTQVELRNQILAFSAAAMAAALILSLLIAHSFSKPIRDLVIGTQAIRTGNLQVQVPIRSGDELGELADSFNEMATGLAQKELYRTVLNMVADEKVAHALVNGQLALGGEVREITVLFCDIRGFTALTENMPPEDVIEMLNEHMTALTRLVKEHHGVLDKFVGDLLMAIFGAPVSHEHDTLDAARCALRLIQERQRLDATSRHQLQIGIGIATGKVVAGCMGSADRLNYTVLGERVNLASRLCSHAGPGQILIDQTTREKLAAAATSVPLPALNLKGYSENIIAYELQEVHSWEEPAT